MNRATTPLHNRVAIFFDFDETLAPKTDEVLLEHLGIDPEEFAKKYVDPLKKRGFETILAKAWSFIQLSNSDERYRISRALFEEIGRRYPLYPGVSGLFAEMRRAAKAIVDDVEVEFHLLTAGFREIPASTPIASEFTAIWGGEYEFDDAGNIAFVKSIIAHAEKTRYVLMVAKGLDEDGANGPDDVWVPVERAQWHVPLDQVIYLGDGNSDTQVFGYLYRNGGIGIGIHPPTQPGEWETAEEMHEKRAVDHLAQANYEVGSDLFEAMTLAVKSVCHRIKLRKMRV